MGIAKLFDPVTNLEIGVTSSNDILRLQTEAEALLYDGFGNKINSISGSLSVTGSMSITIPVNGYGGQIEGLSGDGDTIVGNPVLVSGQDGLISRTVQVDSLGRIVTAPAGSSTSVTASLATGYVLLSSQNLAAVRNTDYIEQTTNAQRSIVSSDAQDSVAGTGARTVRIDYFDQNYNGPFSVTLTMNGTTAVNTGVTNLCFLEQVHVLTVGSNNTNAGTISLRTTTDGGGSTFASITAGDGRTFYAHHYVPVDKTSYITGLSVGHNGTASGTGAVFTIRARPSGSNVIESQISDFIRLFGQSSTVSRNWGTALKVPGPARITVYTQPEGNASGIRRAAIDLYDQ